MKLQTYPPGYDTGEEQVTLSDLQSHARTLLAVAERMEHGKDCAIIRAWPYHEGVAGTCDVCELRRGLEVML